MHFADLPPDELRDKTGSCGFSVFCIVVQTIKLYFLGGNHVKPLKEKCFLLYPFFKDRNLFGNRVEVDHNTVENETDPTASTL